jgi:non-specific serine/threonine protein kinase
MVRLRGQWIELDARRLAAGLKLVGHTGRATVGELLHLGLGVGAAPDGLPVEDVQADGWLGDLLSGRTEQRLTPIEPPASFAGQLRPYQARGLAWLDFLHRCGLGGVLADDMGLGKTVQLLALLARDAGAGTSLLICPMSLVGNWQREAARFTPQLRVHVHHGKERARGKHFLDEVARSDLVVTTYALAARDAADLRKIAWRRVVVDEAQAIKNAATKQATAIRSLPAGPRIAVTGTPVENRLADLWSLLDFANPGQLGTATTFKKRYAEPIERHGDDDAAERLRRFTGPFILRRVKTDKSIIADLPDKLEMDVVCNLTAEQAALYRAVVDDMLERISGTEGIERRGLVLATMTKLKQVCNHPAQFLRDGSRLPGRSGKLNRLDEILGEVLAVGERALLFTQYAEFGSMLRGHLSGRFGREVLFLHGGVPKAQRDAMVARFQADDAASPPLFVLSLKAGGTGLTLTAANHVVHVDRWWNPAVEDQATDRAFRIGQRRSVQVRKFVCAGTIEEKIATMIRDKRGLAARIVGTGEQWLTELSTSELATLFRLEAGAVVE